MPHLEDGSIDKNARQVKAERPPKPPFYIKNRHLCAAYLEPTEKASSWTLIGTRLLPVPGLGQLATKNLIIDLQCRPAHLIEREVFEHMLARARAH